MSLSSLCVTRGRRKDEPVCATCVSSRITLEEQLHEEGWAEDIGLLSPSQFVRTVESVPAQRNNVSFRKLRALVYAPIWEWKPPAVLPPGEDNCASRLHPGPHRGCPRADTPPVLPGHLRYRITTVNLLFPVLLIIFPLLI